MTLAKHKQKDPVPNCQKCGKPVNKPKGVHRVLVFGVGWFHKKCRKE